MIKKIAVFLCLFTLRCLAQTGYTTVTAANVTDSTGTTITNATIQFAPVAVNNTLIAYQVNGNGQASFAPVRAQVTNGTFSLRLADTNLTKPQNICYSVTVNDNASGTALLGSLGYTCVQPQWNNYWCVSGACDFDGYQPNLPNLALIQTGPQGSAGPACSTGSGVCTMTVPIVLPGDPALPLEAADMNFVNESAGVNVTTTFGSDIGVKINSTLSNCGYQCTARVPAGTYNYSTTIVMPERTFSSYGVHLDDGAVLNYTGTGDAVWAPVNVGPNVSNWKISGGQINGAASAQSGVHILPTNSASVSDVLITGFSNGSGIWVEGANGVTIFNNTIQGNQNGIKLSPTYCAAATCGTTVSGSGFTPNAVNILSNRIDNNTQWGIISTDPVTAGLTGALNDIIYGNDMELNGSAGSTFGAISFGRSHGLIIDGNYFEGSPRQIVLGIPGGADGNQFRFFASQGPQIINNFFTDLIATPFDLELEDTADAVIAGNSSNQVSENSSNCSINTLVNNGTNIGETGTFIGKNHWEHYSGLGNLTCIGGVGTSLVGAASYALINNGYQPYVAYQNWSTAATATETVPVQFVTANAGCFVTPINAAAASAMTGSYISAYATASITFTHPATAGMRFNIFCANNPSGGLF